MMIHQQPPKPLLLLHIIVFLLSVYTIVYCMRRNGVTIILLRHFQREFLRKCFFRRLKSAQMNTIEEGGAAKTQEIIYNR